MLPPAPSSSSDCLDVFGFVHAGIRLALEACAVARILRPRPLAPLLHGLPYLSQCFYEAGDRVPIIDFSLLFGRGPWTGEPARIVLLSSAGHSLGVCAEGVLGLLRVEHARLLRPTMRLHPRIAGCVRGVSEDTTIVLDGVTLLESVHPFRSRPEVT
jgi:chemotaxis signal transduction protein